MFRLYLIVSLGVLFIIPQGLSSIIPLGSSYYISEGNATFVHALATCKTYEMHLLRIDSETENENVYNLLTSAGFIPGGHFWMGGIHLNIGTWVWVETGVLLNYTKWGQNEPNLPTSDDYCLQLGKDNDGLSPKYWQSKLCSTERYYICETN